MRDARLDALAVNLLDHSLRLQAGEKVLIEGEAGSLDLMIALVEAAYAREAVPFVDYGDPRLRRAWLRGATREHMDLRCAWETQRVGDVDAVGVGQVLDVRSGPADRWAVPRHVQGVPAEPAEREHEPRSDHGSAGRWRCRRRQMRRC